MESKVKRIKLESVGAIVEGNTIYPMLTNGEPDYHNPTELSQCINDVEWIESLSIKDIRKLK